ncbi:MAG TPA: hypothetical protein VIW64_12050 [Pyrinomonadaceae bacterium]
MTDKENAQTLERAIVETLDREFAHLYVQSSALIDGAPADLLYAAATASGSGAAGPVGECVLRCAAAIEQTFGGITANLWDDPFEWTLPEYLSTRARIRAYLDEVEETRRRAFSSFTNDDCLLKQVAIPSGDTVRLVDLLRETLARAAAYLDNRQ